MHLKGYDPCTRFDFGVLISTPGLPGLCMTPASKTAIYRCPTPSLMTGSKKRYRPRFYEPLDEDPD